MNIESIKVLTEEMKWSNDLAATHSKVISYFLICLSFLFVFGLFLLFVVLFVCFLNVQM